MIEVRSYRRVFDLERRIYRIDRLRLLPGGVPVRGLVYLVVALCFAAIAAHAPLIGVLARALPWYVVYLAGPLSVATAFGMVRIEGRPFHLAAPGLLGLEPGTAPLRASGGFTSRRWHPEALVFLPDGGDSRPRALRYRGPGVVMVRVEHRRIERRGWRTLTLEARSGAARPQQAAMVSLAEGSRLRVRESREVMGPAGDAR